MSRVNRKDTGEFEENFAFVRHIISENGDESANKDEIEEPIERQKRAAANVGWSEIEQASTASAPNAASQKRREDIAVGGMRDKQDI